MKRAASSPLLALFLFFQGLYTLTASGWVWKVPDELEVYLQVESLVDRGSLAVPQARTISVEPGKSAFFGKVGGDDRATPYAPYGPGVAFLILPHHLVARGIVAILGVRPERTPLAWRVLVAGLTSLAGSTAGALAVAGLFRAARALGASERRGFALAVTFGAATVLWPEARTLFSETFAAAAFTWAAALLLEGRRPGEPRRETKVFLASGLLFVAVLVKATNVLFAAPIALTPLAASELTARARARAALILVIGVVAAALVHARWNVHRFGSPFDLGYDWSETVAGPPRLGGFGGSLSRGLIALLLSPGKSLFAWAPAILCLAVPRARELARDRALLLLVTAPLAVGLLAFGAYIFPEGGYCHGPRHLVPILPLLLLPAALGAAPSRTGLGAALILGTLLNFCAATTSYLEDQVWRPNGSRDVYYELVRDQSPGLPRNVYRLDYAPEVRLPRLLFASLERLARGAPESPGCGVDAWPLHLARLRADPGLPESERGAIPRWLGPLLDGLAAALLAVGARLSIRTLLSQGNAAILAPRE